MKKRWFSAIVVCLLLLCVFSLYVSRYFLQCSYYMIHDKRIEHSFRIVQLTDLHNSTFGTKNEKLVQKVLEQNPDIILITGDLINETEENLGIALELISSLSKEKPVYISFGNHEVGYEKKYGVNISALYTEAGARVLNFDYEDIEINGQRIRLGGIYGYCLAEKYLSTGEAREEEVKFLKEYQNTSVYTILMCHMPATWIINNSLNEWDCDLVLCGHSHGGQIRIPLVGGLYAPDQGYFCGKEAGLYYSDDQSKVMLLSRGLGSNEKIPRMNNIPEIVIVDFRQN